MQPTLYYVPIEPFPGRYTESWYKNFPIAFQEEFGRGNVITIDGMPLTTEIRVGTFLDMSSTVHYKATQLQAIARLFSEGKVVDGDVFFFGDIEYWGIESVRLMADMHGLRNVKITGFLHAASYTIGDAFAIAAPYQQFTELGWVACMDKVFVGSHYHKKAFIERRLYPWSHKDIGALADKIVVTGNPLFSKDYPLLFAGGEPPFRARRVVLPNRFDSEKGAMQSLAVVEALFELDPSVECILTTSHHTLRSNDKAALYKAWELEEIEVLTIRENLTKPQYHTLLNTSAMMLTLSLEENFGYCVAEALTYGCKPLMMEGLSHVEFLDPQIHPDCFFPPAALSKEHVAASELANMILANLNQMKAPYYRGFYPNIPFLTRCSKAAGTIAHTLSTL